MERSGYRTSESALTYVWSLYKTYDKTASKLKASYRKWRFYVFLLTSLGAIFGTLSHQFSAWEPVWLVKVSGGISALFIGLSAYFSKEILGTDRERQWVQARTAAESLKKEAFLYVTGTTPYKSKRSTDMLFRKVEEYIQKIPGFPLEPLTEEEKTGNLPPSPLSANDYIENRIKVQINDYYMPKMKRNLMFVNLGKNARVFLGAVAVILGGLHSFGFSIGITGWVAVISTLSSVIASYLFSGRYSYLALSHQTTVQRLEFLIAKWESSPKREGDRDNLVKESECAIGAENSSWMAQWNRKKENEGMNKMDKYRKGSNHDKKS